MAAINEARYVLIDPARRAAYDRWRRAAEPPRPRLEPAAVDFGTLGVVRRETVVAVRVLNDGGTPSTVRVEPESDAFWELLGVRGGSSPEEVAVLEVAAHPEEAAPGPRRSRLTVLLDDRPAELLLTARVLPSLDESLHRRDSSAFVTGPTPGRWPRRSRPALVLALGSALAAALMLWPGAPGTSLVGRPLPGTSRGGVVHSLPGPASGGGPSPRPAPATPPQRIDANGLWARRSSSSTPDSPRHPPRAGNPGTARPTSKVRVEMGPMEAQRPPPQSPEPGDLR